MERGILIIGQALPAVKQEYPYDTTMLYDWLNEVGISKEEAQNIFEFDAVYDKFPGFDSKGGHLKPTKDQMEEYYEKKLKNKIENCKSILVLGNCAKEFLLTKEIDKPIEFTIHPSKRNSHLYNKNKENVISKIKNIIK